MPFLRIEKPYSFKIGLIYFGEETFTLIEPMLFSLANFNFNFEVIFFSLQPSTLVELATCEQPKINTSLLIKCPPDTEIFSKRRKIYSICVESMRCRKNISAKSYFSRSRDFIEYKLIIVSKI